MSDADTGLSGLKIMVIDDSKTIRRTAENLLKKAGCEVVTATDGFEALSLVADHHPDLIFVDIMMPRLDGYQTNNKAYSDTPVVMLSSKDGLFDRAKGVLRVLTSISPNLSVGMNCWTLSGGTFPRRHDNDLSSGKTKYGKSIDC